jgi:acetolactate synthase-1/3 small subunit
VADGAAGRLQQFHSLRARREPGLRGRVTALSKHILSLLVEDKPGLLTRVAGLFARRGFNIDSLAVGSSEVEGLSRMTVVVNVEDFPLEQVTKQLNKLVNVIKIVELDPASAVEREHILVKVRVDKQTRSEVIEAVNLFRARVVDVAPDSLVIETTGDSGKVQALLRMLEPYGIRELVQSGLLAVGRGPKSISERVLR